MATISIFGQVERPPVGGVYLGAGNYDCDIILTEESFHGSGGTYAGNWAAAMGAHLFFTIAGDVPPTPELPAIALLGLGLAGLGGFVFLRRRNGRQSLSPK